MIYVESSDADGKWYEAQLPLPAEASSLVRAFKTLYFPSNRKGEVTDEDFALLKAHGHIGKGRLELAEDFHSEHPRHSSTL